MPTLDELLSDDGKEQRATLDDLLSDDRETAVAKTAPQSQAVQKGELPWYRRMAQGVTDPLVGAGQLVQNVLPDSVANWARSPASDAFGMVAPVASAKFLLRSVAPGDASTEQVNAAVRSREEAYQAERKAAGQEGLDWWRVGGTVANPVSWAGGGGAATAAAAAAKGAGTGALQALMQPVTEDGIYAINKGIQTTVGAGAGGIFGAALHGITRGIGAVIREFRGSGNAAAEAADLTDDAIRAAGADPAKVDRSFYGAIKQEIQESLANKVQPDPRIIANRADAAALPVPINMLRGQASRDPMQFSWEQNTAKLRGGGERLSQELTEQNRALIENLNVLGAREAPTTFDASTKVIQTLGALDDQLKSRVDEAYSAVRDAAGRPAMMDREAFQKAAVDALEGSEYFQLSDRIPEAVAKQYNAVATGGVPLTVDVAQRLDRSWGAAQRATKDAQEKTAIGLLRKALAEAPVNDQLGEQAMQAYKVARTLAAQRFALHESSPAFKAVVDGVEPDKFFQKHIAGANVSEVNALKQLIGADDTRMLQNTAVGNLKKLALNRASDENGVFSQAAFNKALQDPVAGPRMAALFSDNPQVLDQLRRLGRVSENLMKMPAGHGVNTSNTAPTMANIVRDVAKSEAGASMWNMVPFARPIREVSAQHAARKAVDEALAPGVSTLKPAPPPAQINRLSDLLTAAGAAYGAREATRKGPEDDAND